ncbi:opioid growth factor receptor-like [Notothenia coriiceps]|uniref:Opioid growth factor receptor-like n=1 Tax=Notothenia coriiceps TaxID=8208 RepID=A0A6I9NME1_9TELE|nr:PREDICTED: opioid growth factor receptor-like [Notothenia coriiceps]
MRPLPVLLCRLVEGIMAFFNDNEGYSVFEWFLRSPGIIWRCMRRLCSLIVNASIPIRWRSNYESPEEPKTNPEVNFPASSSPKDVEQSRGNGPPKRSADYNRDLTPKERQGFDRSVRESEEVVAQLTEDEDESEKDGREFRVDSSDEFYCGYDSTWETEDQEQRCSGTRRPAARHYKFSRFENAAKDMQNYRHDYPSLSKMSRGKESGDQPNLKFQLGMMRSVPDDAFIKDFHNEWYRDYNRLESEHSYIQWLFPLQEPGMNYQARTLTKGEIKDICQSSLALENLLESYKLMLDFYGIELLNEQTGELTRGLNWKARFNNLNSHTHNNLRITRILKCLGTLGYPHYQAPLVHFFLEETLVNRELPQIKDSVLSYFVFAVLSKRQRRGLIKFAYLNYDRKDEFVWCPKKIQMMWSRESVSRQKTYL